MLQFKINTVEEFIGTLNEGYGVIISSKNNKSVIPNIEGFVCILEDQELGQRTVYISKEANAEKFSNYEFDAVAITGQIPEGTNALIIPDEEHLVKFATSLLESEKLYIFAVYNNPLI